ncbi:MAG: VWA domain-containing protein, partial [Campylobacterota bacterium]|nr:VWA domain-containing protein [Campylobacterota bacterium]
MMASPPAMDASRMVRSKTIGFSVGGAKDSNNFFENIKNGYLPKLSSITYEGQFYSHYFDTGVGMGECKALFCPSYSKAVVNNIFTDEKEYYLSVGLNSGIKESDFARKKLNLVVVLDISGSMGNKFKSYYYDKMGKKKYSNNEDSKMQIANRTIVDMIDHLEEYDRLGIVLFDDQAYLAKGLREISKTNMDAIKKHILEIEDQGGTNWSAGYTKGLELFSKVDLDNREYENRIIFITDAMPNRGELSKKGLFGMAKRAAKDGIYTTFIGVGVDFNNDLVEYVSKMRGANYYSIHSDKEFKKRLDEEFDYMVTPMVFDLKLSLKSKGYKIVDVYGSPNADKATGRLMQIDTLFPSKTSDEKVKGGVVLLKLEKSGKSEEIELEVSYEDREGKSFENRQSVTLDAKEGHDNSGIAKAILVSNYVSLMKNWLLDSRAGCNDKVEYLTRKPGFVYKRCISSPKHFPYYRYSSEWERKSCKLNVSDGYHKLFSSFRKHYIKQMEKLEDSSLKEELEVLDYLIKANKQSDDWEFKQ